MKSLSHVRLCDPMDGNLPGSAVHGIFQARILEWTAICFSRESSQPRDQTRVSCIADRHFTVWATREAPEYTEDLYKKDLHDPDNRDGVMTHLEPDILEYEVKWVFGSITTKLVEEMEFHLSYFKYWKMMLWKCCTQYPSKFGKLNSGHRTGKSQFSF